ncbi:hypothetical protein BJ912DRAFT_1062388 [Pholiota molesta]|nr:hypothetical protein BJ912DRAFT_1062388 [Pholiota molesta]
MALNLLKSFLPATDPNMTNPDIEMNNLETRSRTASASESLSRPASPHSNMDLYTEDNAAILGPQPLASLPSGEQLHPPSSPSISQTQNPVTSDEVLQADENLPVSQVENPMNSDEAPQTRQHFAQFDFNAVSASSTDQLLPLLPAAEIIPPTHTRKRRRSGGEPSRVRIVRQPSLGIEEVVAKQFEQKHAEFEKKQKEMEERQRGVERTLQEADQWAKEESNKRKLAEAQRAEEQVQRMAAEKQRKEEEARLGDQLAKALKRAEDLEKEVERTRNEAAEQIRQLTQNSTKMQAMMEAMMAKIEGINSTEERVVRVPPPGEIRAQDEPNPMDLYDERAVINTSNTPSLAFIATPWQASTPETAPGDHQGHIQPPMFQNPRSPQRLASPGPSNSQTKGKAPIRGGEYDGDDGDDEDDEGREEDEDMEAVNAAMERGASETPEPSEIDSDSEEVRKRARARARARASTVQDTSYVPPPTQFVPPRGGGHSAVDAERLSNTVPQRPSSRPTEINRFRTRTSQSWTNGLATYYGQDAAPSANTTSESPRKRTKTMAGVFRKTALKGFDHVGAARKTGVRHAMNELLGINKDDHIINKESATEEEVYRHRDGGLNDPALCPMRPYFLKGGFSTWNDRLCEKFVDYYEEKLGISFTDTQKMDAELHFMERLNRLGRLWRKSKTKSEEERIAAESKVLKRSRANTRRSTLYDDRREIAGGNLRNRDGTIHEGWKALYEMVERMGPSGMSSDESEVEGKRTVYIVKRRAWRSEEVQRLLIFIDQDRNATGSTGCARPGNPPRERRRLTNRQTTISKRDPTTAGPMWALGSARACRKPEPQA